MTNREKLFKNILDSYGVEYAPLSVAIYSYAMQIILSHVEEEDGQFYFFLPSTNQFMKKRKIVNNKKTTFRTIIIEELKKCHVIEKKQSFTYDNIGGKLEFKLAERFRLNTSFFYRIQQLTNEHKSLFSGVDDNFKIIDKKYLKDMEKHVEEIMKKLSTEEALINLNKIVSDSKIKFPTKELHQEFADNMLYRVRVAYYNEYHSKEGAKYSEKTGRVFHPMTNLPKVLRQYVQIPYKGRKFYMKSIDLKSSQPLLLTSLIDDEKYTNIVQNEDIYDFLVSKIDETTYTTKRGKVRTYEEALHGDKCQCKFGSGANDFKDPKTRDGMKVQFMRWVATNRYMGIIDSILKEHLPEFYLKASAIKAEYAAGNYITDEKGDYITKEKYVTIEKTGKTHLRKYKISKERKDKVFLTTLLQQIEAKVFLDVWREYSEVVIPLHDALYFPHDPSGKKIKNFEPILFKSLSRNLEEVGVSGYDLICKIECAK